VENTRRRLERDKEEAVKNAAGRFARDIIPVAENLTRALSSVPAGAELPEPVKNLLTGVEMTERELLNVFERHGIRRIDPRGA
ncbi:nucleotide exchange factor GrpE, partial [Klebsiella pneumoniae]|uniref:nucleotide exchange factor GrpE n=1 Tax=Klebsiella pneumoniae TaxID=573 RepID=UPI003EE06A52